MESTGRLTRLVACLAAAVLLNWHPQVFAQWPQWGGPNRDFTVEDEGLAKTWAKDGPPRLWHRELGDGYSSIVVGDGTLYTMYRIGNDEFTVALDASTGNTMWEHKNPSPFTEAMTEFGPGPHSTPLVSNDRLFTIGTNAVLHCFDAKTGKVLWKHDLAAEFNGYVFHYGYACSPIAFEDTVIVPVDRRRTEHRGGSPGHHHAAHARSNSESAQSLMAFDQETGRVVWKSQDFKVDYASPILVEFAGRSQLVLLMNQGIMGVDPGDGRLLWHHPIPSHHGGNYSTPLRIGDDTIFCSSSHTNSRMIKLTGKNGVTLPEETWESRQMRISHGNAVRFGDYVMGSSGRGQGPALLVALNIRSGKRAWVERGFDTATFIRAEERTLILTEDGRLALTTPTPERLNVHSQCVVTERLSWTAPTLVGTTLYVRDRKHITALDLG